MTTPPPPPRRRLPLAPLAAIAAVVAVAGTGFLSAAGRLGDAPPTARTLIGAIEAAAGPHPGYRRAHSRGVCVGGWFQGTADGAALSSARVFAQGRVPVLGRLSIGGGDPHGAEAGARVRSLALQLRSDDGADWRLAMNSFPFFAVPSAEAFLEQTRAQIPDPATGKPDPARMAAVLAKYPSARVFRDWAARAPWPDSWANTTYNGIHTFVFVAPDGHRHEGGDGGERSDRWASARGRGRGHRGSGMRWGYGSDVRAEALFPAAAGNNPKAGTSDR